MPDRHLVLLPGLHGNDVLFRPLIPHLPPQLHPLAVNYPPDQPLGYTELLPLVLAKIPTDAPFVLLGESFSGPLALMAAATRPAGLLAVVLCATFVRNPLWLRPTFLRHIASPLMFQFLSKLSPAKNLLDRNLTPELRALSAEANGPVRPNVMAHRVRAVLLADVRRELLQCPAPILYLRAERDRVVPRHNLTEITRLQPSAQVARFLAPHMVLQTRPSDAAAAIWRFVDSVSSPAEKAEG